MKKITLLILIVLANRFSQAQQSFSKDQLKAQEAVIKLFEAISNRDSVSLKAICTPDVAFYEYGQIWNIDTLINKTVTMNKMADFKRTNTFDFIDTKTDKNQAWLNYRLSSSITREGKQTNVQWLETVILAKENKKWKLRHLHSTVLKRS